MRKVFRILGTILAVVLILVIGAFVAAQSPAVQTFIGKRAVAMLRGRIDGEIEFEKIQIKPFDAIVLKNVVILDRTPYVSDLHAPVDTFVRAGYITARFSLRGLFLREGIHVYRAAITDGAFHMVTEPTADGHTTTNLARIFRLGPGEKDPDKPKRQLGNLLDARTLEVRNFSFMMVNYPALEKRKEQAKPDQMDFANLHVYNADVLVKDLKIKEDGISAKLERATAREKCGLHLEELSCHLFYADGNARIRNLRLKDDFSDLKLDPVSLSLPENALDDLFHNVVMDAVFDPSIADMRTLAFIVPPFKTNGFRGSMQGRVTGSLDHLVFHGLTFKDLTSGVQGRVEGALTGLPDPRKLGFDMDARNLQFTMPGLDMFVAGWASGAKLPFDDLARGETLEFNGTVKGLLSDMQVNGEFTSELGGITANVDIDNILDPVKPIIIGGAIRTEAFNVGRLIGNKTLGLLDATARATIRILKGGIDVQADTLQIDRFNVMDYDYRNISASGSFDGITARANLISRDPNLLMTLQADATLPGRGRDGQYLLTADVKRADLHAIHLDKRDSSVVSFGAVADLSSRSGGSIIDCLVGTMNLSDVLLTNAKGTYPVGDATLRATLDSDNHIFFNSGFADAFLTSDDGFGRMVGDFKQLILHRELSAFTGEEAVPWDGGFYDLRLKMHDSRNLLAFVFPGLYVADSTEVRFRVTPEGLLNASVQSSRLALNDKYLRHVDLRLDNRNDRLNLSLGSSEIRVGPARILGNQVNLTADDNHVVLLYDFDNATEKANKGHFKLESDILRDADGDVRFTAMVHPSAFWYEGDRWGLKSSSINYGDQHLQIGSFTAWCNDQSIDIHGGFSPTRSDTLSLDLKRFELGIVNSLLGDKFGLTGLATGNAYVISPATGKMPGILARLDCERVQLGGHDAGDIRLATTWNESKKAFDVLVRDTYQGEQVLSADGFIRPDTGEIDITTLLNGFNPGAASSILSSLFSDIDGKVYGTVRASGTFKDLQLSSEGTRFENTRMTLGFTKVTYFVDGPFHIDNQGAHFDHVGVRDRYDGKGAIDGGILFNHFQDIRLNIKVMLDRMEGLNLTASDFDSFYGNAFGTGTVRITGPLDRIALDIDVTTTKEGTFHLPLGSRSVSTHNLLTFKQPVVETYYDPYEAMLQTVEKAAKRAAELSIRLKVNATPLVKAFVELGQTGQAIGRGRGHIDISVKGQKFAINGNYTLNEGKFNLNMNDIAIRDFDIQDGSTIRFNGDVMKSDLDINAIYRTKASLSRLVTSTNESGEAIDASRQINCGIHIYDKLSAPKVDFSIDIPDLDPTMQNLVANELNSPDKVQRQFVALLLTNNFLPSDQSGIVNTQNESVMQGLTSIMAGQINRIFQRYEIPVDVKMNYKTLSTGYDIFDVAVSTQLFNNRVIVNGNLGNRQSLLGEGTDVVGDIDIQIKLNKPGTLRLNVFSHSADAYTNYLDMSQRNGAGISYQQGFNTFNQFLNSLTLKRKRKIDQALSMPQPTPRVTIAIDSTGKVKPLPDHAEPER